MFERMHAVKADASNQGGGTYRIVFDTEDNSVKGERVDPLTGYMVAVDGGIENLPNMCLKAQVLTDFAFHYGLDTEDADSGLWLGLWFDGNGRWSVDRVMNVDSLTLAISMAKANNQRAIWDCANKCEITV